MGVGTSCWLPACSLANSRPGPQGVSQLCSMLIGPSWLPSSRPCLNRSPNNSIHYVGAEFLETGRKRKASVNCLSHFFKLTIGRLSPPQAAGLPRWPLLPPYTQGGSGCLPGRVSWGRGTMHRLDPESLGRAVCSCAGRTGPAPPPPSGLPSPLHPCPRPAWSGDLSAGPTSRRETEEPQGADLTGLLATPTSWPPASSKHGPPGVQSPGRKERGSLGVATAHRRGEQTGGHCPGRRCRWSARL